MGKGEFDQAGGLTFTDLVQECLLHWWTQRATYSEQREASPRTYMNRVLTNRLRDLRRAERAQRRRGDLDPQWHRQSGFIASTKLEVSGSDAVCRCVRLNQVDTSVQLSRVDFRPPIAPSNSHPRSRSVDSERAHDQR